MEWERSWTDGDLPRSAASVVVVVVSCLAFCPVGLRLDAHCSSLLCQLVDEVSPAQPSPAQLNSIFYFGSFKKIKK
jgi:hypothetical protein